jgi:hypothetical protein
MELPPLADRVALAGLVGLVLFLLRKAVFGGRVFYERDIHLQWYGQMESFARSIAAGSWPLWDPYVSFGQPLLANANNQLLYPPTWLNLVLRPWTYYTLFFVSHLVLAAWGLFALTRRLGSSRLAAFGSAALWLGSGPLLSLGNAWNHLAGVAWMPWILLALERAATSPGGRAAAVLGLAGAAQVATGSPDMVVLTAFVAAPLAARHVDWGRLRGPSNTRFVLTLSAAAVLALGLTAAQWIPSLEVAARSDRWSLAAEERTYWSVHPLGLLQLLVPLQWFEVPFSDEWRAALFESREPFLFSIYLGLPALLLAALGASRGPSRLGARLAAVAVLAVLFALGRHTPLYASAIAILPPLKVLRFPAKALVVAAFCGATLAGLGLDRWRGSRGSPRSTHAAIALLGVVALLSIAGAALARYDADAWAPILLAPAPAGVSAAQMLAPTALKLARVGGLATSAALLAAARRRGVGFAQASGVLLAFLGIADLTWSHRNLNRTADKSIFRLRPEAASAVDQSDLGRLFVYDYSMTPERSERYLHRPWPYLVSGFRRDTPYEWAGAFGLRMYLVPPTGAAWRLYGSYERDGLGIQPTPLASLNGVVVWADRIPPLRDRLLRLGAVTQVLSLHTEGFEGLRLERTLPAPFLEPIRLYRVPGTRPRTYVVAGVRAADGKAALDTLVGPDFDEAREVVLPGGRPRTAPPEFRGESRVTEMTPDRVVIEATTNGESYVVLVDAWDPGWRARMDGVAVGVLRANVAFRAVRMPPGRHTIEMRYRPSAVSWGAALSVLTLLALGAALAHPARAGAHE